MKKQDLSHLVITLSLFLLMAFSFPSIATASSSAGIDEIELYGTKKDHVDGHWLPNLTGLPSEEIVTELTQPLVSMVANEDEKQCRAINPRLRMLVFQHFVIHQYMANEQNIYFNKKIARKWAHVLAMILKESSGDAANITDMKGHSKSTYRSLTSLSQWRSILELTAKTRIKLNYQTNFGLTQTSSDRLFNSFQIEKNKDLNTEFLEGKQGSLTQRRVKLNTAIAIRRLIWFYQDFTQGRFSQTMERIHQRELYKPELNSRYLEGLRMAVLYCGTRFMFDTPPNQGKLRKAMASIAYCTVGDAKKGYGKNEVDAKCFAQWVTLCPNLNVDIAILTPLSYFETRGAKPVCESTFERLIVSKKPKTHNLKSVFYSVFLGYWNRLMGMFNLSTD
ncbi:hypothetical protein BN59_02788 [Legionella massiliensis]|uniref:Uncharacterized protein n=1 Tax=Legionella massiliensis TaxID=1034943 RepID=A0A078L3G2_9GAMM|nr:hypothetical protein [Legionella massiliensis]CDZ78478.1 hypothetical protein BN59_02788 [Legionella massiliensis]CEE14216.1 hypothetical protein BN1094_02788 [Legionella massiliensis]